MHEKIAIVTGAGSGVGAVIAEALADHNNKVVLVGRRIEALELVQKRILAKGGQAIVYPCDVSELDQVNDLVSFVKEELGTAQIVFHAAGIHCEIVPIAKSTPSKWLKTLDVNVKGTYLICNAFMEGMIEKGWGRIINVSSAASLHSINNVGSIYQLSKVAVNHFTRQLALELEGTGVTANVIHPGEVKTEMWAAIKEDASLRDQVGATNWAKMVEETGGDPPEKTAELVLELLSEDNDNVNGQYLWIKDGIQTPIPSW